MHHILRTVLSATAMACLASVCHAQVYVADLSGLNEVPPNASPGIGFAMVTLDPTGHTMRVQVTFNGLLGTTTNAHIHSATTVPGAGTAGVATQLPSFVGFPLNVSDGTYDNTFNTLLDSTYSNNFRTANGGTAAGAEAALFSGIAAGKAYLNIHTDRFTNGEIRGFLVQAVPEPGTTALLVGISVSGVAFLRRRRAARKTA